MRKGSWKRGGVDVKKWIKDTTELGLLSIVGLEPGEQMKVWNRLVKACAVANSGVIRDPCQYRNTRKVRKVVRTEMKRPSNQKWIHHGVAASI